ncbi:RNA methyltransferase [Gemella sp. ND 6198]|uniref:TrmH family RNA methyltransferase n=1 Tax=Gemella sp. ND 6198 TaxID=2040624 RepID=UPI000E0B1496|nr:RNA methyltransferase [Gemella sp. ND 6198]AXI26979.1 RNA methyltransferase [Gemella sp. ND 6198]
MITSGNNKKIKELQKLKKNRNIKKYNKYLVEGIHLVKEALKANVVEEIIISENFNKKELNYSKEFVVVSDSVIKLLGETVTSQGVIAVCSIEKKELDINCYNRVLILDRVQDPGNLGTIIRTADAFSFDCVVLGNETTSLYGQKVLRSTQGSQFHIDCFENIVLENLIGEMKGFDLYATSLKGNKYLEDINDVGEKIAVIFGNEGAGVDNNILEKVNNLLKIKMTGEAESLNVAVAAGIIMNHITNNIK